MSRVAVVDGLSIDHLADEGMGARFSQAGGPGLFGSLGARLVAGTQVKLIAHFPDGGGFAEHACRGHIAECAGSIACTG